MMIQVAKKAERVNGMRHFPGTDEGRLLLACARLRMDKAQEREAAAAVGKDLDWNYIAKAAYRHRIAPLVFENLKKIGDERIPEGARAGFRKIVVANASRFMRLDRALRSIAAALHCGDVPVMLLKGMALVRVLYGDGALRPMGDIDLLVREDDFDRFRACMHGLGFDPPASLPDIAGRELVEYGHYFDQVKFYDGRRNKVDTHFRLLNMGVPAADDEEVWRRARTVLVGETPVSVPSPEDMLLHLCFHANHHHFASLGHFCDIAGICERFAGELDWDRFVEQGRNRRMTTSLYQTLRYTTELLGPAAPEHVMAALRPSALRRMAFELVWERVVRGGERFRFESLEGPIYYILEMDGLRDKLRFVGRSLFPPKKWLSRHFSLPESRKLYLKYFARISRGFRNAIQRGEGAAGGGAPG